MTNWSCEIDKYLMTAYNGDCVSETQLGIIRM